MSKAVLVIDMPESCEKCCFCRGLNACKLKKYLDRDGLTTVFTVDKQIIDGTKPDWCPLKPMPSKRLVVALDGVSSLSEWNLNGQGRGWNACIDAIEGNGD